MEVTLEGKMHKVERELIKTTGYKVSRKFDNRQDYLGSILNSVMKLSNDDFDNLSDEAAAWANAAVEAKNSKEEILPDFDEVEPDEEAYEDGESGGDPETSTEDGEDSPSDSDDDPDTDGEPDETSDAVPHEATLTEQQLDHDPETGEVIEEDGTIPEDDEVVQEPIEPVKPTKAEKRTKKVVGKVPPPGKKMPGTRVAGDAVLDKFGAIVSSINHKALKMFEKGCSMKDAENALGGTFYNILKRAVQAGHRLEKVGSILTLTHRDEVGVKSGPAAKPTPKQKAAKKK
jgi:hypothetical protein